MATSGSVSSSGSVVYFLGNVPGGFHSCDLRAFFSHLVEKEAFACFHFRHRPEYKRSLPERTTGEESSGRSNEAAITDGKPEEPLAAGTMCCVLLVKKEFEKELVSYGGQHWTGMKDELTRHKVRLKLLKTSAKPAAQNISQDSLDDIDFLSDKNTLTDIYSLPELNPPAVMPNGNVGTPLSVFRELIRSCTLPPHVIKKLKLKFPLCQSKRRYGTVSLDYGIDNGTRTLRDVSKGTVETRKSRKKKMKREIEESEEEEINESDGDTDDDDGAEEWERYEALHNDVDKQGRTSERLFEEEMEVVWDKGSSGLVFYTDANYWDELDGDFEEKCSKEDDWDVDMSLYYGYESADKPAVDMREIEIEQRLRAGEDLEDIIKKKVKKGKERRNKIVYPSESIGSRLMKEKGWRTGEGLGKHSTGIPEPLEAEGQTSHCKAGLGYHGEKVSGRSSIKTTRKVLISTIYDKPNEEPDTIHSSAPSTTMKYRP